MHRFHLAAVLALGASALSAQSAAPNAEVRGTPTPAAVAAVPATPAGVNAAQAPSAHRGLRPDVAEKGSVLSILVYDENTHHGFAATAAQNLSFFGTTVANASNFNSLLASGSWDAVAVDCPSTIPSGGWTPLINYVNGGGEAILSYWDWDNGGGFSTGLAGAFDVSVSSELSFVGKTLFDSGTSPAFLGVTMPNADWHDDWSDDGDQFNPLSGAQGLAHVGTSSTPVMVRGNAGKTIAAPALDEAGDTWIADGSAVQLWENMIMMVGVPGPKILVYDVDTVHHLAMTAAFEHSPGGTQGANQTTFSGLLSGGPWEAVLVDAPDGTPFGGWGSLINFANGGGHVAMSFWDWDNDSGAGDPALPGAFDVGVVSSFSWNGLTLFDSGVSDMFAGVTLPNSSWHDHFFDDGDRFTPIGPAAKGVAHVGSAAQPAVVWGNSGRTIAGPVFDEEGDVWDANGSGVQLWRNLLSHVTEPEALCTQRNGILGLNPIDYTCITPPVVGGLWKANVSTTPKTPGAQTLTTFVTLGLGGPVQGFPIFGYELLILPPYFETTGFGLHNISVSPNPLLVGLTIPSQGARLELVGSTIHVILTNGQDVTFGF